FHDTKIAEKLVENGALGRKTKAGFYKKVKNQILVFDPKSNDYVEQSKPEFPILGKFSKDLKENMDVIFNADDASGFFMWEKMRNNFYYSALNVPYAAYDYIIIAYALVCRFNYYIYTT